MSTVAEMGKTRDLTDLERGMIIGYRAHGGSISETAKLVKCSRKSVVRVYRQWTDGTVSTNRRANCGAPPAIQGRGERRLRRMVREDGHATVEQLTARMNLGATRSVSKTTVQRTLWRMGLRSRRPVTAPMLTTVHRRKRLQFARQYQHWTCSDWRRVAFSDQSRFQLHRVDGRWRVRREASENKHPATVLGRTQAGGGSVMVWGMFSWHCLGPMVAVEGTLNRIGYLSILADAVHPYMLTVFPGCDGIYQQDNAPCHTAGIVRQWLEEHDQDFQLLPWPPNSPDLNPIEHLWDYLDRHIRGMDPPPRTLHQLSDALQSAWLRIPVPTFQNLILSLPRRLAAVRAARGGYSGY